MDADKLRFDLLYAIMELSPEERGMVLRAYIEKYEGGGKDEKQIFRI